MHILIPILSCCLLLGCAGEKEPSFGKKLHTEGADVQQIGDSWLHGESLIKKGHKEIATGNHEIESGKKLLHKGKHRVNHGKDLIVKGKKLQKKAESKYAIQHPRFEASESVNASPEETQNEVLKPELDFEGE